MSAPDPLRRYLSGLLRDYGMLLVLFALAAFLSVATWDEQHPTGAAAAQQVAGKIRGQLAAGSRVLIVARAGAEDAEFAGALETLLPEAGMQVAGVVRGQPVDARKALVAAAPEGLAAVAAHPAAAQWAVFENLSQVSPGLAGTVVITPENYYWPNFLKSDNLLNVANQIVVIAILAIGMTLVVISGGIDLSVGSLIALSAVLVARLIRDYGGGVEATTLALVGCSLAGIVTCALCGAFSAAMVTAFRVPPFIVTLAMMLMASGFAYRISSGESIDQIPPAFMWLGRGTTLLNIPNAVLLMVGLYVAAHILMTRTVFGRYIYAVGGNAEAARLSGVPVQRVLLAVYTLCGALAGLGGVVLASLFKAGAPTYGQMYEMYVIAAVVVGGASLSGGEGRVLGTLIGAFIIAVIQNGMNLLGIHSDTQRIVLGAVILSGVLLDKLKSRA